MCAIFMQNKSIICERTDVIERGVNAFFIYSDVDLYPIESAAVCFNCRQLQNRKLAQMRNGDDSRQSHYYKQFPGIVVKKILTSEFYVEIKITILWKQ